MSSFGHTTHKWVPTWKILSKGSLFGNLGSRMQPTFSWNNKYIFCNPWLHTLHFNIGRMVLYLAYFCQCFILFFKIWTKSFSIWFYILKCTYDSLSWQWLLLFCTCNIIWNVIIASWYIVNTIHSKKFQLSFQVLVLFWVTSMIGSLLSKLFP